MKIRVPDYFKDFKCIASECEDTCCAGWEVVIDDETYKHYQEIGSDFGMRLKSEIEYKDGENIFVLEGNKCPFLNENKLCDIYSEIGEDSLCYTCKQYPRYTEEFGSLREIGISMSCPEAARLILRDNKKADFELSENREKITSYNDIDALLFMNLLQCRKVIIDIIQKREFNLENRAAIVLRFVCEIQEKIDQKNIQGIKEVKEKYLDKNYLNQVSDDFHIFKDKGKIKYQSVKEIFIVFKKLKHINKNDPLELDKALKYFWERDDEEFYLYEHKQFNRYYENKGYKFENLLVYFTFRYFMKAVFDDDVISKVKLALVSYLVTKELFLLRWVENGVFTDEDAVDIMHMYSKDIEHLEENIGALSDFFCKDEVFKVNEFLIILMN